MLSFIQTPENFAVEEELFYQPCGQGPHLFAKVKKKGISHFHLLRRLSEQTGTPLKLMRHAGKKDHLSTATQWFSWPLSEQKTALSDGNNYEILEQTRHTNGLSIGHVLRNHFRLTFRCSERGLWPPVEQFRRPFANFFGSQRFGKNPFSLEEVHRLLEKDRVNKNVLSVVQAFLFNQYLAERLKDQGRKVEDNELWSATNGKTFFQSPLDDDVLGRFEAGSIAPTGPVFGYKMQVTPKERNFLERLGLTQESFRKFGKRAKGSRRVLWITPKLKNIDLSEERHPKLSFSLPSGAYATVFLQSSLYPVSLEREQKLWPDFTEEVVFPAPGQCK